ncbi:MULTISPECIES: carbohydrate porin [unclassified Pseudomonas]|uniref:carbohydrate porin n=1 Tax=unclassified Pseudomonas TaxID=196821 RepID=UPI001304BD13|nr:MULTISPECIES: carbohydrate porin [unclassified Pseudomonas]
MYKNKIQPWGLRASGMMSVCFSFGLLLQTSVVHAEAPFADIGANLKDAGITPHLFTWNTFIKNVSVGPREGESALSTNILAGADFDLEKSLGVPGGTFLLQYIFFPANRNVDATSPTGDYFGAAGGMYAGQQQSDISTGYLSQFAYRQSLFDDKVELTVGRFSAGVEFYHKGTLDCLLKVDCVDPVFEKSSGSLPPPYGSWAGMAKVKFTDRIYAKAGIFQLDLNQYLEKKHGFNWSTHDSLANNTNLEIGYETDFSQVRYPEHYWATIFNNSYDLVSDDGSGDHANGTTGFMLNARKTVWRADGGEGNSPFPESIMLYGSYSQLINPDSVLSVQQRPFKRSAEAGASYIGPFNRPMDVASVAVSMSQLSDRYHDFVTNMVPDAKSTSVAIRAKYNFMLSHGFFVEPGLSYVFNPDDTANAYGLFRSSSTEQLDDGLMVRLTVGWNVGQALGL